MFFIRALSGALVAAILLLLVSSPVFVFAQPTATTSDAVATTTAVVLDPHSSVDVAAAVASYFADIPTMAAIAKCESNDRQYTSSGNILNGGSGGMIGVFQINKSVHAKFALSLGYDINTLQGNMAYARYLYSQEGTEPWDSSELCWGTQLSSLSTPATSTVPTILPVAAKISAPAKVTSSTKTTLTADLKLGTVHPQVATLQKLLNLAGFVVAKSGAGSPGNETSKFGAGTLAAVQRFQCAQNIVCKGTEATTGYGFVGAKTRAALAETALAINR